MPLKHDYSSIDDINPFDVESLTPGKDVAVKITNFSERSSRDVPVIELTCEVVWTEAEADQQYIGNSFKLPIFTSKASENNLRILRDTLRKSGFQVSNWTKESDVPPSVMLPSSLKLLALRNAVVLGKVTRSTNNSGSRNFFNLSKLVRVGPDGVRYPDALPDVVPDELVLDAYHTEIEDSGDSAGHGGDIPV